VEDNGWADNEWECLLDGKVIVVEDSTATQYLERPNRPGVRLTNFWIERGSPAEYDGLEETCMGDFVLHGLSEFLSIGPLRR